jgi:chromosome partitioning protein
MVAAQKAASGERTKPSAAQKRIVERWLQLPIEYSESDLLSDLLIPIFDELGVHFNSRRTGLNVGKESSLRPDLVVYGDIAEPPLLTVELKRRVALLAEAEEQDFTETCQKHLLYRHAVGYEGTNQNGILQYLNQTLVKPECLASYGLIFNGDFFQLWRRVDGLIFPLTPIQKVTKTSLPKLIQQLFYCLKTPSRALVVAAWNKKGGVAKTTNTINIGATLALKGKRVLLLELDPQGDLTQGLGMNSSHFPNYLKPVSEKLQLGELEAAKAILDTAIQRRQFPTTDKGSYSLSLLSASREALENFRDDSTTKPSPIFKKLIQLLKHDYDYIFIDASPSPDLLSQCLLYACDAVLIPIDFGGKALNHGLSLHQELIPKMRELRSKHEQLHIGPWSLGLVFSNCPTEKFPVDGKGSSVLESTIAKELKQRNFTGCQYKTSLKTYAQATVAEFRQVPVVSWQSSPITKLYENLTNEVFLSSNFTDQ